MKTKILVTFLVATVLAACGKDKYTTKPQLTFKSVNTTLLQPNQSIQFIIEVTDREGDIQEIQAVDPEVLDDVALGRDLLARDVGRL